MKEYTVCARAQASIFTVLCPFRQRNCKIVEEVWTMREQVVKSKGENQGVDGRFFFTNCVKNVIEKAASIIMRNNTTRLQGKKKNFNFTMSKFWAQRYWDMWPTKVGKPWREKRRCTLHAGMVSGKFANFISKNDRPANSRDANPLVTVWIIFDETTYKDPAPKTLDYLRQRPRLTLKICEFRLAMGARTFYTSPLRKCQKS